MLTMMEAPESFVSLPQAKKHLEISPSNSRDDAMIQAQIAAAISYLDGPNGYLGAAIASQKWQWQTCAFIDPLRLPFGPVLLVDEIRYRDADNVTQTLDSADFYLFGDASGAYIRPVSQWPGLVSSRDDAVTVEFTAGRAIVPPQLHSAALLIVGHLYRYREITVDARTFPTGFDLHDLAHPYRVSF